MNLSIETNYPGCPTDQPVALVDTDAGRIVSCHRSIIDAQKARTLAENLDPIEKDPGIFGRCAISNPPTISW